MRNLCLLHGPLTLAWGCYDRREQGKAHIWSVDGHDDIKRLFNVTTGNIHSIAFDPESTQSSQGMPDKMLLGDDHGKMTMINLKEAQFGNQMGVLDARGFGAGCVRHVSPHKHPLVAPPSPYGHILGLPNICCLTALLYLRVPPHLRQPLFCLESSLPVRYENIYGSAIVSTAFYL